MTNTVTVTESNNSVTVTESNNTVQILEDAPVVTADPWYADSTNIQTSQGSATVTASATPHTKGAWTEIIASNGAETSALLFRITGVAKSSTNTATLIDIGTGAGGSESAIASNIAVGGASLIEFVLPVKVASGARIAVRSQAVTASDTVGVEIRSYATGDTSLSPTTVDVLGAVTASSQGTAVGTAGTYYEVEASTSQEYAALGVVPSCAGITNQTKTPLMKVAVGAAAAESDKHEVAFSVTTTEAVSTTLNLTFVTGVTVAAGSRISVTTDDSVPTTVQAIVIGVPAT